LCRRHNAIDQELQELPDFECSDAKRALAKLRRAGVLVSPMDGSELNAKRVILVTGGSSGFGRLIAETLARKGYNVFATMRAVQDRNANAAAELRELAERESLQLRVLELDVTDDAAVERCVNTVIAQTDRIDVLVNNAGYALVGLAEACTVEQAQRILNTNFLGAVRMNRAILPHMRRRGGGLLVHISSGAGRIALPTMGFYSASKFALEALAESYRYELAPLGIDAVIVEPGAFPTAVLENAEVAADPSRASTYASGHEITERVLAALSSSRGNPQEVADCVRQLVEMPAGKRPLRVRVGSNVEGFTRLNDYSEQLLTGFLDAIGIAPLAAFRACP
jgi:NAD(P)-dependent dehydrogenase (short-subunit alcohol dehydrogenase family)